jgi:NADPH:quinone reductase-like Zn-dependent oxidoreductase
MVDFQASFSMQAIAFETPLHSWTELLVRLQAPGINPIDTKLRP